MNRTLVLVALVSPSLAFASGHHTGGGGHGGGTRPAPTTTVRTVTWTPSSYSAGYYRHEPTPACVETTDIVGFRECTRFGAWSQNLRLPPMYLDVGVHVRRFPVLVYGPSNMGLSRTTGATSTLAASSFATASAMRIGAGLPSHLYIALEGELGGASSPPSGELMPGTEPVAGTFLAGYGVFGATATSDRALFAVELAGGGRNVIGSSTIAETRGLVAEARARGELWLGPWMSIGATLGTSVLERGDWLAGVYVGVQSRAFGGGR